MESQVDQVTKTYISWMLWKEKKGGIRRLTEGPWIDTHCNWSPDGEWIVFASDRGDPSRSSVQLYLIHPNGTGLRKVFRNWLGGQAAHPWFSPDGISLVFTTDYAGASAEPISTLHQFQSAGEIFIAKIDGSEIQRMTHNIYEDGTPTWGPAFMKPADVALGQLMDQGAPLVTTIGSM
ncbi:hypothetical protein Ancab_037451 [Ancistrocladus abbreviatus]